MEQVVQALQRILVKSVQKQFPVLTELAQEKARICKKPDVLEQLCLQILDAPDVLTAQQLLESMSE
jgi:hypothetical protein